jgi:hydroxypyruvate isomerase
MNRRRFAQSFAAAAAAVAAAAPLTVKADGGAAAGGGGAPFGISIMLWTVFTKMPFEERLARVAEAGYRNVQLVGEYRNWTDADFERANAARKKLGIRFDCTAGLKHGVADPAGRAALLDELRAALEPMEKLECPAIIVTSGNVIPGMAREEQHACAIETLKQAAAVVEGRKIAGEPVRVLLENIDPEENPRFFMPSSAECIEVVEAVNHPQVQFLYDLYHEQIAEGNLIEKLEKHIDTIGLIHVADVPGRHEPGTGEINYANIYKKLAELNYRRNIAMEFHPTGNDPVATLRTARIEAWNAGAV